MPLTKNESKRILLNAFRLAMAVSEKRTDDATVAYSNILDSALLTNSDDDMPPLIPLCRPDSNINLVISEIEQEQEQVQAPYAFASVPPAYASPPYAEADCTSDYEDEALVEQLGNCACSDLSGSEHEAAVSPVKEVLVTEVEEVEAEEVEEEEEEEEEVEEEEEEEEVEEEEVEEEEEEEVEELELEPVRIKKVIYWKDSKSGDIYICLPEDEVGDKVGRYVDGKPVFD